MIVGFAVMFILFLAIMATTNIPRSNAAKGETVSATQQQGPIAAAPTPIPTPPPVPPAVSHVFELEGNSDDEINPATDWDSVNPPPDPSPSPGFVTGDPDGMGPVQIATFVLDTQADDRIFTQGGSKDFNEITQWRNTAGSVPDKDEINHAYAAILMDKTGVECTGVNSPPGCNPQFGHQVLVFGGDRHATNGDANIGFWFFQNAVGVNTNDGTFSGVHKNGDLFIVSAFTGGGGTSTIDIYEWVGTPNPMNSGETNLDRCNALSGQLDPSGDDTICKLPATSGKASAIVNPLEIFVDWPYTPKGAREACANNPDDCSVAKGAFYEGGIDLTELNLGGTCFSSFMLETRSSASVDAVLKDFALGSFDTCALTVTKTAVPTSICQGGSATYKYSVTNTGVSTLFVTVVDDNGTPNNCADDIDLVTGATVGCNGTPTEITLDGGETAPSCSDMPIPGCITDRQKSFLSLPNPNPEVNTVVASGRLISGGTIVKSDDDDASVTVNQNPSCNLTGTNVICHFAADGVTVNTTEFCGPAGLSNYSWTGPNGFTKSTQCTGLISAAGLYTLNITDANGCMNSCSRTLTVNENPACNISGTNEICEKDAAGNTNTTTFTGPAGAVSYSWTGPNGFTKSTQSTGPISAAGTYFLTVTDANGCSTTCSRTLTVNPNPSVSITPVSCDLDGSITLSAVPTGGTGGYSYVWSTGATSQNITVNSPGPRTVTVTDSKGCVSAQATIRVGLCAGP
jgi:hypothetical protein